MPPSIRSFDRMIIPAPCDADWDSMTGNDQVRFCEHCSLHVTNLSSMTRQDAIRLVARSQGRLCARFVQRPNGGVLTKQMPEKLHQIGRRVSRIAAGAFTATLSLSSAAAQSATVLSRETAKVVQRLAQEKPKPSDNCASLSGTVTDPNGAVVAGATVTLINVEANTEANATSSDEGEYTLQHVSTGTYKLRIMSPGFKTFELTSINLSANASERFDASLEVSGTVTMGVIAYVEPEEPLVKAAFKEDLEKVEQLAFASPDVNVRDKNTNMTALDQAVENGNLEIVRTLLRAGANVNVKNEASRTPLMFLRDNATVDLVRELLSASAMVNARDESGATALMSAASQSKYEVVKELIDAGSKIDLKDADGKTALMFAATNEDPRISKMLIDAGAEIDSEKQRRKDGFDDCRRGRRSRNCKNPDQFQCRR